MGKVITTPFSEIGRVPHKIAVILPIVIVNSVLTVGIGGFHPRPDLRVIFVWRNRTNSPLKPEIPSSSFSS